MVDVPPSASELSSDQQLQLFTPALPLADAADLPTYQVRESRRARHVSIRVSPQGVEVVVPQGFDQSQVPALVQRRRDWIAKTLHRLAGQTAHLQPDHFEERPSTLTLRACQQQWHMTYQEGPGRLELLQSGPCALTLRGDVGDPTVTAAALRPWLTRRARATFAPWLRELSFDLSLPFQRVTIRGQKTRWASCSSQKNISLNYKLLFLPPDLVHYVFVHELCHTVHMNHSSQFWHLVGSKLPTYGASRDALKDGWQYVPRWVELA